MKCPHCKKTILKSDAIPIEHNGDTISLRDLSKATGIAYTTLQNRYEGGLRGKDLIASRGARRSGVRLKEPSTEAETMMRRFLSGGAP
jgi:hypothetical protein